MIQVHVYYPNSPGAKFDGEYYHNTHMPLVRRLLSPAIKGLSYVAGVAGGAPGSPPTNIAIGTLYFESVEAFGAAMAPHSDQIMGDVKNYTDITPIIDIGEVRLLDVPAGAAV